MHTVTIFWASHKVDKDGETLPPVSQDAAQFGVEESMFCVATPDGLLYYFPVRDIETVMVVLASTFAPDPDDLTEEAPEEPKPLIVLPNPKDD